MILLPMGLDRCLGPAGIDHDELVYSSLDLMKRAISSE
jgi:hypothetical protein